MHSHRIKPALIWEHLGVNCNVDQYPSSRHDSGPDSRLRDQNDEWYLAGNLRDPKKCQAEEESGTRRTQVEDSDGLVFIHFQWVTSIIDATS